MALARLTVDFVAKMATFEADLKRMADSAERQSSSVVSSFGLIKEAAKGLAGAFSLSVVGNYFAGIIEGIDNLNDLKDATGASIENLSALQDIAKRTNTPIEAVGAAVLKLNKYLLEAEPGSAQAKTLRDLGLSAEELRRIDPAEAVLKVALALDKFADDGAKGRVILDLFGKSTRELAPLLNDLAAKGKLVATVTTDQAREAEAYRQAVASLRTDVESLARAFTVDLVKGINEANKAAKQEGGILAWFRTLVTGTDKFKNDSRLTNFTDALLQAEQRLDDARRNRLDPFTIKEREKAVTYYKTLIEREQAYRKVLTDEAQVPTVSKPSAPSTGGNKPTGAPKAEEISEARLALGRYVDQLQRAIDKENELTETERAQAVLNSLGKLGQVEQVRELVFGLARQADALKNLADEDKRWAEVRKLNERDRLNLTKVWTDAAEEEFATWRSNVDELERLSGRVEDNRKRRLTQALEEKLQRDKDLGLPGYSKDELDRIVLGIAGINVELEKTDDWAKQIGMSFQSAAEDALVNFKSVGDVVRGLFQDIARIAIRKSLVEPFGSKVSEFFSTSSFFSNLFGKAAGGPVMPGGAYLVGERGPEILQMGGQGGRVTPNNRLGSSVTLVSSPTISIDSRSDLATVQVVVSKSLEANNERMIAMLQRQGVLT